MSPNGTQTKISELFITICNLLLKTVQD